MVGKRFQALSSPSDMPLVEEQGQPNRRSFYIDISNGRIPHNGEKSMAIDLVFSTAV